MSSDAIKCYKCFKPCELKPKDEKSDLFGYPCDTCKKVVCRECTGLLAQEVRCVPSRSRGMLFFCPDCVSVIRELPNLKGELEELRSLVNSIQRDITKTTSFNSGLNNEVKALKEQVKSLDNHMKPSVKLPQVALKISNPTLVAEHQLNFASPTDIASEGITNVADLTTNTMNDNNHGNLHSKSVDGVNTSSHPNTDSCGSPASDNLLSHNKDVNILVQSLRVFIKDELSMQTNEIKQQINILKDTNIEMVNMLSNMPPKIANKEGVTKKVTSRAPIGEKSPVETQKDHLSKLPSLKNLQPTNPGTRDRSWIFLSGLAKDNTVKDVLAYLRSHGISGCECEELTTSNDQVKSFKIGVNSDIVPHILDSQSWPKGVIARKFLNQRRRFYNRKK